MTTLTRAHAYEAPPAGHVDAARHACTACGYGPAAPQHARGVDLLFAALDAAPTSVTTARQVANLWLEALDGLGGNAEAWGSAALRAVLAALDGETDLDKLYLSGLRMRVTRDGLQPILPADAEQPPLPLTA